MRVGRRRKSNKHLPRRVYQRHGRYWFVDRAGKWHDFGTDLSGVYRKLAERAGKPAALTVMNAVFDRYLVEVLPKLAPRTQSDYQRYVENLRVVFGEAPPREITAGHVFDYRNKRALRSVTQANREKSCLSSVFTAAIEWHAVELNPCHLVPRLEEAARGRYVEDAEFSAVHALASPMMQATMDLAIMTGQRESDLLSLPLSHCQDQDDGMLFVISKSKRRHPRHGKTVETAKRIIIEWSADLRAVVARVKRLGPDIRPTLLCKQTGKHKGQPYTSDGFRSNWHRLVQRSIREKVILESFTFHDLRAKSASDDTLELAHERLAHDDPKTTQKVYRRKPRKVKAAAQILEVSKDIGG